MKGLGSQFYSDLEYVLMVLLSEESTCANTVMGALQVDDNGNLWSIMQEMHSAEINSNATIDGYAYELKQCTTSPHLYGNANDKPYMEYLVAMLLHWRSACVWWKDSDIAQRVNSCLERVSVLILYDMGVIESAERIAVPVEKHRYDATISIKVSVYVPLMEGDLEDNARLQEAVYQSIKEGDYETLQYNVYKN
jgi:dihydroxyacetone kinase DhaKLM complex PTS-EIIA-like component DhaM